MPREVIWITGASAGIGKAIALAYAAEGALVAATARPSERLDEVAEHPNVTAFAGDITDGPAMHEVVRRIEAELGPIDRAILNAGTHQPVKAEDFKAAELERLLTINVMGTAHCLEAVLQPMLGRRGGQIAVVSSVAGYTGLPTSAYYGATKAALFNMCEALKFDLDKAGVDMRVIAPGFVRTPLTDKNEFSMPFLMEPEAAAQRVVKGLKGKQFEVTFPRRFSCILKVLRILPYAAYFALVRRTVKT
ncbi:MAG: SDR family NAD(P)-dependent oxidoreductase [Geminicoccaceae bacterium]|nr:MAG: SDR family NAD(P)-dependent oxidoreductase [Geminicoccaceae bacterium]